MCSIDDRVELGDGRGELKLKARVIQKIRAQNCSITKRDRVSASMEDAGNAWQRRATDDSIGIRIGVGIEIGAKERIVLLAKFMIQPQEAKPIVIDANVNARSQG